MTLALQALARGWHPVAVHSSTKKPVGQKWQLRKVTRENVSKYFAGNVGVGLQMGPKSNGLTDIDLDCGEAIALAPYFLPKTNAVYGRASKPCSHRLFYIDDPDPKGWLTWRDDTNGVTVELKLGGGGKGSQCVMPGSVHTSGEVYAWDAQGEPAKTTCAVLKAACIKIAAGAVLMRHWPQRGALHDTALGVGGFLARAGWPGDDVERFVFAICRELRDVAEPKKHAKTARDSVEHFATGGDVRGLPWLIEFFDEGVANTVAKIIGYHASAEFGDIVETWNTNHAHVLAGGKSAILQEYHTVDGHTDFKLLASAAFHEWNAEHKIQIDSGKFIPVSKYWLSHHKRRKYQDIGFFPERDVPGFYNLWRGFAVKPTKGDCSRFLAHLHENICQGDDELYDWVIAWLADIFQRPGKKCGTSLALRGKQGVGKTKIGEVIGSLLGVHYKLVADPRFVTGRFNSHMISLLMLHADEGFWAGDKKAEGKLKDLVTGDKHPIEFKGKEAFWLNNHVRLLVSGNQHWQVPAGFEERRFGILDAGDAHQQDHAYFAAIDRQMNEGGREALLYHLLFEVDCSKVNLRQIPHTVALVEQKLEAATPEQGWWLDILRRGSLPGDWNGTGESPSAMLFDDYVEHARKQGVSRRSIETMLGLFLQKIVGPGLQKVKRVYTQAATEADKRGPIYVFPPLKACRKNFAALLNEHNIQWDEEDSWCSPDSEPPMGWPT